MEYHDYIIFLIHNHAPLVLKMAYPLYLTRHNIIIITPFYTIVITNPNYLFILNLNLNAIEGLHFRDAVTVNDIMFGYFSCMCLHTCNKCGYFLRMLYWLRHFVDSAGHEIVFGSNVL